MELLHRMSAQAIRGGLRLRRISDRGCAPEITVSRRERNICRMAGRQEEGGPVRYRPRQSTTLAKQVSQDDSRRIAVEDTAKLDTELHMVADEPERQVESGRGTVRSRSRRQRDQGLPATDNAVLTNKRYTKSQRLKQEPSVSSSTKGPLLLHLTYADGRKVETTFEDGRSIFDVKNDEVEIVHETGLIRNLHDEPKLDGLEMLSVESRNDEVAAANRYALSLLAAAPQPVSNLRKKLSGKNISLHVIEKTIKDLQRCGLQSDREYAELFARSRWRSFSWGPSRIKLELKRRGVSQDDIEIATKRVFETIDFEENVTDNHKDVELNDWGMTDQAKERLLQQASRQWQKGGPGVTNETRQRRMVGWLQRRGFKWSIVVGVLKSLDGQQKYDDYNLLEEDVMEED